MDTLNLFAFSTASFVFSRKLGGWAELYDLGAGEFRAQMRDSRESHIVLFEWSTANERIVFDVVEDDSIITLSADIDDIRRFDGTFVYDCAFIHDETVVPLFGGTLTFQKAITRPE